MTKMSLLNFTLLCESSMCPVKCRGDGEKEARRNIRYGDSRIYIYTSKLNSSNYNVEYRDGLKSRGDNIGMPCTHTTVI